jgi:hypothetical protein
MLCCRGMALAAVTMTVAWLCNSRTGEAERRGAGEEE